MNDEKTWDQLHLESEAQERYVAFLIEQDQDRRIEDQLMAQRSRFVRALLRWADYLR